MSKETKKAIITYGVGDHYELLNLSLPLFRKYAILHGYDLIIPKGELYGRPASWGKIPAIYQALDGGYEWVVWMDCDLVIVDGRYDLLEEIPLHAIGAMAAHQVGPSEIPNGGLLAFHFNARGFLRDVWNQVELINHGWWEQAAMMHLLGYSLDQPHKKIWPSVYYDDIYWLTNRWNSHPWDPHQEPYIRHATPGDHKWRVETMTQWIRESQEARRW